MQGFLSQFNPELIEVHSLRSYPRFGQDDTASRAPTSQPDGAGTDVAATVSYNQGPSELFWTGEPSTLAELEDKYEVVCSCPGRLPTTMLKIVKAETKAGEALNVLPDQKYKLFLAPRPD